MNKKGFASLWLIGALVVVLGIGGYFIMHQNAIPQVPAYQVQANPPENTQTTSQTSSKTTTDWKTYTNATYGFEFQYPANLIAEEAKGSSRFEKRFTNVRIDTADNIRLNNLAEGTEGVPIFLEIAGDEPFTPTQNYCVGQHGKKSSLVIDGITTEKCVYESMSGTSLSIRTTKDGKVYYSINSDLYSSGNVFKVEQIISTFKFTK